MATFAPDGTLLGAQGVGRDGVDKRIDVLATALRAGFGADDLAELELAYAPPFGSAKDPVNMLGFMMQNYVAGNLKLWHAEDVEWARENALILDVRSAGEVERGHLPEAVHIPHDEIRENLDLIRELADGRPVRVHCESGFRSYLAHRVLAQSGFDSANFDGGMLTMRTSLPQLELVNGPTAPLVPA
jgi:rhodanese-related sulfurtransferase